MLSSSYVKTVAYHEQGAFGNRSATRYIPSTSVTRTNFREALKSGRPFGLQRLGHTAWSLKLASKELACIVVQLAVLLRGA